MKSFLIKFVVAFAVVAGVAYAFADDDTTVTPDVTVETLDDSINTTLDVALQYVESAIRPIESDLGPQADAILFNLTMATAYLEDEGVDITALRTLTDEATENYNYARRMYSKARVYTTLGDILVSEADDTVDTAMYALRVKAAACYYEATIYLERSRATLEDVLEIGKEADALIDELTPTTDDDVAARYHLRSRTERFFKRSTDSDVAARYHLRKRTKRFFGRSVTA
jgi:hypothetical protein